MHRRATNGRPSGDILLDSSKEAPPSPLFAAIVSRDPEARTPGPDDRYTRHDLNHRSQPKQISIPSDPFYRQQWHLHHHFTGDHNEYDPWSSANVEAAWRKMDGFGSLKTAETLELASESLNGIWCIIALVLWVVEAIRNPNSWMAQRLLFIVLIGVCLEFTNPEADLISLFGLFGAEPGLGDLVVARVLLAVLILFIIMKLVRMRQKIRGPVSAKTKQSSQVEQDSIDHGKG